MRIFTAMARHDRPTISSQFLVYPFPGIGVPNVPLIYPKIPKHTYIISYASHTYIWPTAANFHASSSSSSSLIPGSTSFSLVDRDILKDRQRELYRPVRIRNRYYINTTYVIPQLSFIHSFPHNSHGEDEHDHEATVNCSIFSIRYIQYQCSTNIARALQVDYLSRNNLDCTVLFYFSL